MGDTTKDMTLINPSNVEPLIHGSLHPVGHRDRAHMTALTEQVNGHLVLTLMSGHINQTLTPRENCEGRGSSALRSADFESWISYNNHGTMNLFVLRHASAGTPTTDPDSDRKRPLDKEGVRHCLLLARVLNAMNIEFDVIVSSPLKRSLQTAALIATETGYKSRVRESDSLAPEATLKDFKKLLNDYRDRDSILAVGHNPNLSVFLGALLVPAGASPAQIRLRKGSLAKLSFTQRTTTLQSVLEPRVVRTIHAISAQGPKSQSRR
jgi:phosphohistidine phosphatase